MTQDARLPNSRRHSEVFGPFRARNTRLVDRALHRQQIIVLFVGHRLLDIERSDDVQVGKILLHALRLILVCFMLIIHEHNE